MPVSVAQHHAGLFLTHATAQTHGCSSREGLGTQTLTSSGSSSETFSESSPFSQSKCKERVEQSKAGALLTYVTVHIPLDKTSHMTNLSVQVAGIVEESVAGGKYSVPLTRL